jgi:hypothetical protein
MKGIGQIPTVALIALLTLLGLAGLIQASQEGTMVGPPPSLDEGLSASQSTDKRAQQEFPVPYTPLPKTITPCRACHGPEKDFPVNFKRREALMVHRNIQLNHGGVRVWCLDCHDPKNRNYLLSLSDGKPIRFDQSYLLCGKCHGTKFRDWRNGIHGKRTGYWNGRKTYYLCVNCHNPHLPKFKPIQPMPPPRKPRTPIDKRASRPAP